MLPECQRYISACYKTIEPKSNMAASLGFRYRSVTKVVAGKQAQ